MGRKYIRYSADEILNEAESNRHNIVVLEELREELKFRSTNRSFEVKRNIENRIHEINTDYFEWPTTHAPISTTGFCNYFYEYDKGLLSYVGYSTGKNGESKKTRRKILDCIFHKELPKINSQKYMDGWGVPKSPARLKKLADSIAAFTRNNKRKTACDYQKSIEDMESDLNYLYRQYYVGEFKFSWPQT